MSDTEWEFIKTIMAEYDDGDEAIRALIKPDLSEFLDQAIADVRGCFAAPDGILYLSKDTHRRLMQLRTKLDPYLALN